jgi:hypothetical protein
MQKFDLAIVDIQKRQPHLLYNEILVAAATRLAHELGIAALSDSIAEPLGNAPGTYPAFPDTVDGLRRLKKYYKLAILSNIDNMNMKSTIERQRKFLFALFRSRYYSLGTVTRYPNSIICVRVKLHDASQYSKHNPKSPCG